MYLSLKVPDSIVYVCVGNHSLLGVLLSLVVIVMLCVGDRCQYTDWVLGGFSELLDLHLVGEREHSLTLINLDGGLDIHPDLVLTSSISSSDGEAVPSRVLCTS